MILRIIDKETNMFIRDDFSFDEDTEIGLDVAPSQGLYKPKWDGNGWTEGATQEYIDGLSSEIDAPTMDERLKLAEDTILFLLMGGD